MINMTTAKQVREHLTSIGVTGAAQDAIVKETGKFRHAWRVEQVKAACAKAAEDIGLYPWTAPFIAFLDVLGVGGTDQCSGHGTVRIPPFQQLGKGRKQATDGAAWDAAINDVALCLTDTEVFSVQPVGGAIYFRHHEECREDRVEVQQFDDYLPWLRTWAREGLRRSTGLDPWFPKAHARWFSAAESAAEWSALLNAVEAELADREELAADIRNAVEGDAVEGEKEVKP